MDNPFEMLLPMAGFAGGLILWSRVAHMTIALSGLAPNPAKTPGDFAVLERTCRRLMLRIAAAWLILVGSVLVYMLYHHKVGFALLFAGIEVVPLLTVTLFLNTIRRFKRRSGSARATPSN
jgi:hypothetical protein